MGSPPTQNADLEQPAQESPRERMLLAAAEVISERGLANTRIADVAKRVGTSPALVVYYFDTKDNLLAEALRHTESVYYLALDELLAQTAPFRDRLKAIVEFAFPHATPGSPTGTWGLRLEMWATTVRDERLSADRQALDDRWRGLIQRVVTEAVEEVPQSRRTPEAVRRFAAGWAALLDGLSVQLAMADAEVSVELATEIALAYAHRELELS